MWSSWALKGSDNRGNKWLASRNNIIQKRFEPPADALISWHLCSTILLPQDMQRLLQLDAIDNVLIALTDLKQGETLEHSGKRYTLVSDIPAKHKFVTEDLVRGSKIIMYGAVVAKTFRAVRRGEALTTANVQHEAAEYSEKNAEYHWKAPHVSRWRELKFMGYRRSDAQVGTRNFWVVVPLVFCENRNILNL